MKLFLTLSLLLILALCIWSGFKRGLIRGIASLLAIFIALAGANAFASRFAKQLVPALNPFVGGFVSSETNTDEILDKLGYGQTELSLTDILNQDTSLRYDYAYECIHSTGFYRAVSEDLAADAVRYSDSTGMALTEAVTVVLCNTISYVGCITVSFVMILILLVALMDLVNLDFHLPNIPLVDEVGGAALGFVKGFVFCVLLCWLLGFLGIVIGKDTCEKTVLVNFFLAFRFMTQALI